MGRGWQVVAVDNFLRSEPVSASDSTCHSRTSNVGATIMNYQSKPPSKLAERFVQMGLSLAPPVFPRDGIPLVELVPWWRLWPRRARQNNLQGLGAAVFPAVATGTLTIKPAASIGQAVFAAMLPLHDPATALAQWTEWASGSVLEESYPGPASLMGVLEHLLLNRSLAERAEVWSRLLECAFDKEGAFRHGPVEQAVALIEAVGQSGVRALANLVIPALRNQDQEVVLAAVACLARLGAPHEELPAELLLNAIRAELVEHTRGALAFIESSDLDILTGLLKHPGWGERVQALRLVEALLARRNLPELSKQGWIGDLLDILLAHLQQEDDCDVVRCLGVTLGLTLRHCGEAQLTGAIELAAKLSAQGRFESLLNGLLIAQLPSSFAPRVEGLRSQAANMGSDAVRALNRVLMSLGDPSGTVQDWLETAVVVLMQMGVIRLPEPVRGWFDSPADCPESVVTAWLLERPNSGLRVSFCAAYLAAHPDFRHVLERIWIDAADGRKSETLNNVGALLAGAVDDGLVSPAELRCCLGHEIGGPLPETPEMLGQLLALLTTQDKEMRKSAVELLALTSAYGRSVAGGCLRALKRKQPLFGEERELQSRFGTTPDSPNHAGSLPQSLQPLFVEDSPVGGDYGRLLSALALHDEKSKSWARRSLEWEKPEAVKAAFEPTATDVLVSSFLQATASTVPAARQLGALLAAGIGLRLLETSLRDRVVQRVVFLAAHDPDASSVRPAGRKAAEALGIADQVPSPSIPPAPPPGNTPDPQPDETDQMLEDLLREMEQGFGD